MSLRVTKWYLDVCDDVGAGAIVYAARVQWRRLSLRYTSLLEFDAAGEVAERTTLRAFEEPCTRDGAVRLANRRLGLAGTWTPLRSMDRAESAPTTLLKNSSGEVSWRVLSARAAACIQWAGAHRAPLEGLGYVERLDVTIPPWRLPIEELHWGRFVAATADVAWIEWRGPHPLRFVWRDGREVASHGLTMSDRVTLRDGPIAETALAKVPLLRRSLPGRMLRTHETKWRSHAQLAGADGVPTHEGWVIHEVVRWG